MRSSFRRNSRAGFTLLESLATVAVLMLTLIALAEFMTCVEKSWKDSASDPFADASAAFDTITRNLASATLETYDDYADTKGAFHTSADASFTRDHLARRSDLDFACGSAASLLIASGRTTATSAVFFAAPKGQTQLYAQSGMNHLFNALGYFIEFGGDASKPSFFTGVAPLRWRLKQVEQPSESLGVFATTSSTSWISSLTGSTATPVVLAENVIALIVLPERATADIGAPIAPSYAYDSRDLTNMLTLAQLPPRVRVVLVAIDEASAVRLAATNGEKAPALVAANLFQDSTKITADLATLDGVLASAKINHRVYQRDLTIVASAWSNSTP